MKEKNQISLKNAVFWEDLFLQMSHFKFLYKTYFLIAFVLPVIFVWIGLITWRMILLSQCCLITTCYQEKYKIDKKQPHWIIPEIIFLIHLNESHNIDENKTWSYLHYKTISSQNVSSETQVAFFFYFVERLCSILTVFKFLYF